MKTTIYCLYKKFGTHTFYLTAEGKEYFLFCQTYHRGVGNYFGNGVPLDEAIDHTKARNDHALQKTMTKMPAYIRYLEREYDIEVLEKTKKRNIRYREPIPMRCA